MRTVVVTSTGPALAQDIVVGPHQMRADEEAATGGTDTGPEPHAILLAALGACASMTLRAYAGRKGWPLDRVEVRLIGAREDGKYVITRELIIEGELDAAQRQRLVEIAGRCPVHRTLTGEIVIQSGTLPA
jgi:putative redox protein